MTITTKEIIYEVGLQNKRMKTFPEILVRYMVFYDDASSGSTEKSIETSHRGSEMLKNVISNSTLRFETTPLKLVTEELDGGWTYGTGAANRARDKINGVWIRAFADGKLIGEYANPVNLPKKQVWKD